MLFRVILWGAIIFFIVRFIVRFVTPLLQISRLTQDRLKKMQNQMNDMQQKDQKPPVSAKKPNKEEYIDYEEVK